MWIIRFQKLKTKDYNYINRKLASLRFFTRKLSGVLLIKASVYHIIEKKSWRVISQKLSVNHIQLFKFYSNYKDTKEFNEIFHYLADIKVLAYLSDNKCINLNDIDNSSDYIKLTKNELEIILKKVK